MPLGMLRFMARSSAMKRHKQPAAIHSSGDRIFSTGRRNTSVKSLCWGFELQGLYVAVRLADAPLCPDGFARREA